MPDKPRDHIQRNNNEQPSDLQALAHQLDSDDDFQKLLVTHGIQQVRLSVKDDMVQIAAVGFPMYKSCPQPRFQISSSMEGDLDHMKLGIMDEFERYLKHAVDDDVLAKSGALNLTFLRLYDDERILHFVEKKYAGEKMLQYEYYDSRFQQNSADSDERRSSKLEAWIDIKRHVQKMLSTKKIVAYWWNNDALHLITELPDPEDEGVWEYVEYDRSENVGMIVLMQSIYRICKENGLEEDVMIVVPDDCYDKFDPLEPIEENEYENPLRLATDINGIIMDDEEDIMKMVQRLRKEVDEHGTLILKPIPSLEEEDWDEDDESWKIASAKEFWDIKLYKEDQ